MKTFPLFLSRSLSLHTAILLSLFFFPIVLILFWSIVQCSCNCCIMPTFSLHSFPYCATSQDSPCIMYSRSSIISPPILSTSVHINQLFSCPCTVQYCTILCLHYAYIAELQYTVHHRVFDGVRSNERCP